MKSELIVSDWNRTLIEDTDDKPVLKQIAMDELRRCGKRPWLWGRVAKLYMTKRKLERMTAEYSDDPESQAELLRATYELYNTRVLDGMPLERIGRSVKEYGTEARERLDEQTFSDLVCCKQSGIGIVILTSAFHDGVVATLGKQTAEHDFDFIYASMMKKNPDGTAKGIELHNYDNKPETLKKILDKTKADPKKVVYMGNDFRDEHCAELVGRFVVPPLATDEFRQHMASKYGDKVRRPEGFKVYDALTMD